MRLLSLCLQLLRRYRCSINFKLAVWPNCLPEPNMLCKFHYIIAGTAFEMSGSYCQEKRNSKWTFQIEFFFFTLIPVRNLSTYEVKIQINYGFPVEQNDILGNYRAFLGGYFLLSFMHCQYPTLNNRYQTSIFCFSLVAFNLLLIVILLFTFYTIVRIWCGFIMTMI